MGIQDLAVLLAQELQVTQATQDILDSAVFQVTQDTLDLVFPVTRDLVVQELAATRDFRVLMVESRLMCFLIVQQQMGCQHPQDLG